MADGLPEPSDQDIVNACRIERRGHLGVIPQLDPGSLAEKGNGLVEVDPTIEPHGGRNAMANHYQCADKKWILFAEAQSDRFWKDFCEIIGKEECIIIY